MKKKTHLTPADQTCQWNAHSLCPCTCPALHTGFTRLLLPGVSLLITLSHPQSFLLAFEEKVTKTSSGPLNVLQSLFPFISQENKGLLA